MLVKFTNNAEDFKGMPLYINIDNIMSVFEVSTNQGSLVTCIYGLSKDTWYIEEGLSEAITIVNGWKN